MITINEVIKSELLKVGSGIKENATDRATVNMAIINFTPTLTLILTCMLITCCLYEQSLDNEPGHRVLPPGQWRLKLKICRLFLANNYVQVRCRNKIIYRRGETI